MNLSGPKIQTAPGEGKLALVGLPVWIWLPQGSNDTGDQTTHAETKDVEVTAVAKLASLRFDMGDGTTITCKAPGTPYNPSYGDKPSPTCGHTYKRSSAGKPDDRYTITATATWSVNWSGGGSSGSFGVTPAAGTATIRVGELQVLNANGKSKSKSNRTSN
jgi:hypothetical protein